MKKLLILPLTIAAMASLSGSAFAQVRVRHTVGLEISQLARGGTTGQALAGQIPGILATVGVGPGGNPRPAPADVGVLNFGAMPFMNQ